MKLLIFGSREIYLTVGELHEVLKEHVQFSSDLEIVSGGARGPDSVAIDWARYFGYKYKIFYPDWDIGKHAGILRNDEMAEYADMGIAFWNGESKGTEYTINKMKKLGKEVIVVRMGL